jgi:hypothetical protein
MDRCRSRVWAPLNSAANDASGFRKQGPTSPSSAMECREVGEWVKKMIQEPG